MIHFRLPAVSLPGSAGTVPSVLGHAAIPQQWERQVGRLITSPHPSPRHPRTGPPLTRSLVVSRKPERPQVSRQEGGIREGKPAEKTPRGHVNSFCGFHGHLCTTSRNNPISHLRRRCHHSQPSETMGVLAPFLSSRYSRPQVLAGVASHPRSCSGMGCWVWEPGQAGALRS